VTVWTGPERAIHDIRRGSHALEVKGTLSREIVTVEIHGLRQLEAPAGGSLHLVLLRFERDAERGASVPDLVRSVIDLGVSRHEFVNRLGLYGYDMADEEEYAGNRFNKIEQQVYIVDDDFPRIVRASLVEGDAPEGVVLIRYTVDLTGPVPKPLSLTDADAVLMSLGQTT
jgi:hypothetical protein